MAAYAVSARISEVHPYRTSHRASVIAAAVLGTSPSETFELDSVAPEFDGREPVGRTWADVVIEWTETTFYLFDPDSWR